MQNLTAKYSTSYDTEHCQITQYKDGHQQYRIEIIKTSIEGATRTIEEYIAYIWYVSTYDSWKVSDKGYYSRIQFNYDSKKQCIDELVRICFKPDFWCQNRRKTFLRSTTEHTYTVTGEVPNVVTTHTVHYN